MVGERDSIGGSNLRAPTDMARRAVARSHENVVTAWENSQFADPTEGAQGLKLLEYWRIVYKHKWVIVAAVAVALAFGLVATLLTPRVYTASTTIEIDRETSNVVGQNMEVAAGRAAVARPGVLPDPVRPAEELLAGPARRPDARPDHRSHLPEGDGRATAADGRPTERRLGAGFLEGGLGVYPVRDSRLVRITFDSPDPALSARVANAFADNFIASNLQRRFDASAYARSFLEDQLAELKAKLEDFERQLVAYATQQQIIQVSEGGGKDAPPPQSLAAIDLGGLNNALTTAKANLVTVAERLSGRGGRPGPRRARSAERPDHPAAAAGPGQARRPVQRAAEDL